jgi:glycosyltransferase involved in cell wall biosynthesis
MSRYKSELPFCIIVPSFNNAKDFRYEFNLQSIFNQDYDNYRVVIVDDASSDNTTALIKHFMKKNKKYEDKVVLITNKKQMTAVPNIHMAITQNCKSD